MSNSRQSMPGSTRTSNGSNIQVSVRCRPLNQIEQERSTHMAVTCNAARKAANVVYPSSMKKQDRVFSFDHVFGLYSKQGEIFDKVVSPIVQDAIAGYNCALFAYGPTGSGKTYSMIGDLDDEMEALWGMVPLAAQKMFRFLTMQDADFTVKVSFLEIHNEELRDLLPSESTASGAGSNSVSITASGSSFTGDSGNTGAAIINTNKKLRLMEDLTRGVVCQNQEEYIVLTHNEVMELLKRGMEHRSTSSIQDHEKSSRSHAIFSFSVIVRENNGQGEEMVSMGQMRFVDLAGAENIERTGARNSQIREAGSINQSLLTLGRVITALVDHRGHIPYRDSKLTRLLQESLGGKAKTSMITTVSPALGTVDETIAALEYATRVKYVRNQPMVNSTFKERYILKEKFNEIEKLKTQLTITREQNGIYVDPDYFYTTESKLKAQINRLLEYEDAVAQRENRIQVLRLEKEELEDRLRDASRELQNADNLVEDLKDSHHRAKDELRDTYVELKATEKVVEEQKEAEDQLLSQGQALQHELEMTQHDLNRMNRDSILNSTNKNGSSSNASAYPNDAGTGDLDSFLAALNQGTDNLAEQVRDMGRTCEDQHMRMQQGTSQMLTKNREACHTLKSTIDMALGTMIGDAEQARDEMVTSCSTLKTHLSETNAHLEGTLRQLQAQLSDWLDTLDEGVKHAQRESTAQYNHLIAAATTVSEHCDNMKQLSSNFMQNQNRQMEGVATLMTTVQDEVVDCLVTHDAESRQRCEQASQALKNKIDSMEQAMHGMMQDLYKSSTTAFEAAATRSAFMSKDTQEKLNQGLDDLLIAQNAILESSTAHANDTEAQANFVQRAFEAEVDEVGNIKSRASDVLGDILEGSAGHRVALDNIVNQLLRDIDSAVRIDDSMVGNSATAANKLLVDVRAAAQAMEAGASNAIGGFSEQSERDGRAAGQVEETHFDSVHRHLQQQTQDIVGIQNAMDDLKRAREHRNENNYNTLGGRIGRNNEQAMAASRAARSIPSSSSSSSPMAASASTSSPSNFTPLTLQRSRPSPQLVLTPSRPVEEIKQEAREKILSDMMERDFASPSSSSNSNDKNGSYNSRDRYRSMNTGPRSSSGGGGRGDSETKTTPQASNYRR